MRNLYSQVVTHACTKIQTSMYIQQTWLPYALYSIKHIQSYRQNDSTIIFKVTNSSQIAENTINYFIAHLQIIEYKKLYTLP